MSNRSDPATWYAPCTPDDNARFPPSLLYVGTSGNISVVRQGGVVVPFANMPVGWCPIVVIGVMATGTTASNINLIRNV